MLWLGVDLTTIIPCLGVSQLLIFVSCIVFKIVYLELLPTPLSIHTSLLLGRLSIGCPLNTIPFSRLPYWCTISCVVVIQNIFVPFLKPRHSVYNTCKSQAGGVFLEVPYFAPSVYKSSKYFGFRFSYDAPKIWNDLPDVCSVSSQSERSSKPICHCGLAGNTLA